jgi:hypothetical protein
MSMRSTKSFICAVCVVAGLGTVAVASSPAAKLEARVDARVEVMSLAFRLAGNPEYNQPLSKSPYSQEVEEHFGTFRDHPVVSLAKRLRQEHGVSFDAVMSLAVHLDAQDLALRVPLDPRPANLDERWQAGDVREFLEQLHKFVAQTGFRDFLARHQQLYDAAAEHMTEQLNQRDYVGWFDRFFGERPRAKFSVIVSLLNGPCNYGVRVSLPDGGEEIISIIGAEEFDADGIPAFGAGNVPTIVHEFCHSYVNPLVDQHAPQLQPAAERIFAHCATTMREQAYGTWQTMMRESLVRACVVRYLYSTEGADAARRQEQKEEQRGFRWVGELAKTIGAYEAERERYASFEEFMPRVVEFFDQYADRYERQMQEQARNAPKVIRMIPDNGAADVDPEIKEIRVYFDRPMKAGGWAVVGGGEHYPETPGKPRYEDGGTVFVLPVRLKPGWSYHFWLNRGRYDSFRSEAGVPLPSVEVNFKTRQ